MLAAFITGFAEQAKEEIDKTNKEISDRVIAGMASAIKKREEAVAKSKEMEEEARQQAADLKYYGGKNLTETQIVGILSSGSAKQVIEDLKNRTVDTGKISKLFVPADASAQADLEQYLSDVGKLTGQAPARKEMEKGAFGIQTRAGEAARARGLAASGMTEEELYQSTLEKPKGVEGTIDRSLLTASEKTFAERKDAARIAILDAETPEEKSSALKDLNRIIAIEDMGKDKKGDLKESDVRSNLRLLDATIKRSIAGPGDLVVYTDPVTNEQSLELSNDIDPKVREQIESRRKEAFKAYTDEFYGQTGSVPTVVKRVMGAFLGPGQAAPAATPAPAAPPPLPKGMTVETLRAQAKEKIQKSPEKADVIKKVFKQQTGEDL